LEQIIDIIFGGGQVKKIILLNQQRIYTFSSANASRVVGFKGSRAKVNGPSEAKADNDVAEAGQVALAERGPAVLRKEVPAAAAHHTVRASGFIDPEKGDILYSFCQRHCPSASPRLASSGSARKHSR